ncbi:heavy-metal-associated domain-containing protein [Sphingomonas sp. CFBP 8760]|uniref:heavy-metal-associated domain-containing protein n=1 Tax=Sphingomonas sp. CFBP 8760 TaxID=2775282 RepID=UPI0017845C15|nr:heavy-metal-associated domain-containing protein [Sphingomonas sp. CFBP 8760]MBD8547350.1 heavy-metal-associated domain-containing protein [Sphingomonas sp. CFBP 8760]
MRRALLVSLAAVAFVAGSATLAQIEGSGRGVAPVDSGGAFEVSGVAVDFAGKTADAARYGGWRLAQRKAWVQLSRRLGGGGTLVSDGTLDQLVSGIVVENEQIGTTRYVARLGVLFDRNRAGALLGVATDTDRSPPMLVMPVQWSAGVGQVVERRSDWQLAWARFRTGNSSVDYIRPTGAGIDPLLLTIGQTNRPGRGWWRTIIDQYGAADILIPSVRLYRQWPGGPVIGQFEARHGPDNRLLGRFSLRVGSAQGLAQLLDAGVARLDGLYQQALRQGLLSPDIALSPQPDPTATPTPVALEGIDGIIADLNDPAANTTTVTVQYDTPGASSVANTEALIRTLPGVRSAATTSLALGGVSLMRIELAGDPAGFAADLQSRGYQVAGSGTTLRISRPAAVPATGPDG